MGFNVGKLANVAGAAIGGFFGGPVGAAAGSNAGSFIGPSEQRLANRQYVQQQRDAISFWNMQNEYNSPVAQMARLREAGLNPMLVYGSGSVDGNSTSAPSLPSYPKVVSRSSGNSSAVEKFFLNKSMQNAEDQSRLNVLNEEYLSLRNDYMRARIENLLTEGSKGANATSKERGIKDLIDEARLKKLLDEIDYDKNHPFSGKSTWGRLANDSYDLSSHYFDSVSGIMNSYMRYIEDKSSKFLKWYDRPSGRKISAELY